MLRRSIVALTAFATAWSVATPAGAAAAAPWHRYVLGPAAAQVAPVGVDSRGSVTDPQTLVRAADRPPR